jgi:hypothetical protein
MTFVKNNLELFAFNCVVYNKLTRNRENLHVLESHLAIRQKDVYYVSANIFNSFPRFLLDLPEDETIFVGKLREILIHNSFFFQLMNF